MHDFQIQYGINWAAHSLSKFIAQYNLHAQLALFSV